MFNELLEFCMLHLTQWLNCRPLRSGGFHRFQRYYETVRLLMLLRRFLGFLGLVPALPAWESIRSPRYTNAPLCARHAQ